MLLRLLVEDASVKDTANILFFQDAIFWPNEEVSGEPCRTYIRDGNLSEVEMTAEARLTLKERRAPPKEIEHKGLSLPRTPQLLHRQPTLVILIILSEEILKVLWPEPSFVVVAHTIAAVLGLVHALREDAKEWVREDGGDGGIAEEEVDEEGCV